MHSTQEKKKSEKAHRLYNYNNVTFWKVNNTTETIKRSVIAKGC